MMQDFMYEMDMYLNNIYLDFEFVYLLLSRCKTCTHGFEKNSLK